MDMAPLLLFAWILALGGAVVATLLVRAIDGALGFGLGAARRLLPRAESAAPPEG